MQLQYAGIPSLIAIKYCNFFMIHHQLSDLVVFIWSNCTATLIYVNKHGDESDTMIKYLQRISCYLFRVMNKKPHCHIRPAHYVKF